MKIRKRNKWNESKDNGFNLFDYSTVIFEDGRKRIWIYILFFVLIINKS